MSYQERRNTSPWQKDADIFLLCFSACILSRTPEEHQQAFPALNACSLSGCQSCSSYFGVVISFSGGCEGDKGRE